MIWPSRRRVLSPEPRGPARGRSAGDAHYVSWAADLRVNRSAPGAQTSPGRECRGGYPKRDRRQGRKAHSTCQFERFTAAQGVSSPNGKVEKAGWRGKWRILE